MVEHLLVQLKGPAAEVSVRPGQSTSRLVNKPKEPAGVRLLCSSLSPPTKAYYVHTGSLDTGFQGTKYYPGDRK